MSSSSSATSDSSNTSSAKVAANTHPLGTTIAALQSLLGTANAPQIVDVRREPKFLESPSMIVGALRVPPELVATSATTELLSRDKDVLVYCVYGHEVGINAAQTLRDAGYNATFLEGGIEAWREANGALTLVSKNTDGLINER